MKDLLPREADPVTSGRHGAKLTIFEAGVRGVALDVFLQLLNLDVAYLIDSNEDERNARICNIGILALADDFLALQRWHE